MASQGDRPHPDEFNEYFQAIRKRYLQGKHTEMTFRTPLENLINQLAKGCDLIQEPGRERGLGAPDFKLKKGAASIGYIETKDIGNSLDEVLKGEQIAKYKESISNIIVTNYLRFVFIRKSETVHDVTLFSLSDLSKPQHETAKAILMQFSKALEWFLDYGIPTITSAEDLASELSRKAKLLKELAKIQLEIDNEKSDQETSSLSDFLKGIRELISDITIDECSDAYAQTMTYGLFLARITSKARIERSTAAASLPLRAYPKINLR